MLVAQNSHQLNLKRVNLIYSTFLGLILLPGHLLCDNDNDIEDVDQVEIMKEALHYMEHPSAGVNGFITMKGWRNVSNDIRAKVPINKNSEDLENLLTVGIKKRLI